LRGERGISVNTLLAIETVPPFLRNRFHRRKKFHSRQRKKRNPHLPRAVARQIIEIPHDLAAVPRMRGRPQATDYQP